MSIPVGRCQHCNAQIFDNPDADPALASMANLCWKCLKPWEADVRDEIARPTPKMVKS